VKIVSLEAENIKRLRAVEIRPDGALVQITGANGQGKTSVLDAVWWAIEGKSVVQAEPIRAGEERARIRLDLGSVIVTRTFAKDEEGGVTSKITVDTAEGARWPSPQKMLDSLVGELSLDPLKFQRADAKAQFAMLRRFVPDVDFEAIESARKADFEARTQANRNAKQARAAAESMVVPDDTPDEVIPLGPLMEAVQAVATHNGEIEARKARREKVQADAKRCRDEAVVLRETAEEARRKAEDYDKRALAMQEQAEELERKIAAAGPLPEPQDAAEARAAVEAAQLKNADVDRKRRREEFLAAAEMPVPGLGFGDGVVTLNGHPFEQASDAEQLRASIAIAMASNPRLRVIRVRDGSLLDENAIRMVEELAREADYQVWMERVDTSGTVGIVIEDGAVKGAPEREVQPLSAEKPKRAAGKKAPQEGLAL
jgi:hypothetical protein